jgi:hypothetical protein
LRKGLVVASFDYLGERSPCVVGCGVESCILCRWLIVVLLLLIDVLITATPFRGVMLDEMLLSLRLRRVETEAPMCLILQETLFFFAPGALEADDLLLDQNRGRALTDVGHINLGASDWVHVVVLLQEPLETGEAVVGSIGENGFYHDFGA